MLTGVEEPGTGVEEPGTTEVAASVLPPPQPVKSPIEMERARPGNHLPNSRNARDQIVVFFICNVRMATYYRTTWWPIATTSRFFTKAA